MADPISETLNGLMTPILGIPFLVIIVIIGFIFFLLLKRKPKERQYEPLILEKEIHKYLKKLFALTKIKIGYGKTLFIGSRDAGFVLKTIIIPKHKDSNFPADLKAAIKNQIQENSLTPEMRAVKTIIKPKLNGGFEDIETLYGFEVCGRGIMNRTFANLFSTGIETHIVPEYLLGKHTESFNVHELCSPSRKFGIWLYERSGEAYIDEIAHSIHNEQMLDSLVNVIPRSTFISDLQMAQSKATFNELNEVNQAQRDRDLDQIRKAKV